MTLAPWIRTLLEIDMKTGDSIYYRDKNGDTFPSVIIDIKKRVKIMANHLDGDREIWVKRSNIALQSENP